MKYDVDKTVLVKIMNGFISSLINGLDQMAMVKAKRVDIYLKKPGDKMRGDISSMCSVFGDLQGTCVISFPKKLAIQIVQKLLMDDTVDDVTEDVKDGIGELANLTVGATKGVLSNELGTSATISIPSVITGIGHHIEHDPKVPCIGCVFELEGLQFTMEVAVALSKDSSK
jgi:CheY-specific phosphatase CheX